MNRLDRALGILLLLRGGQPFSAAELARRFEVSPRTIHRDVAALGELGIPVYAELGRGGGFRLLEGYFLPPVMFTEGEAISLLLGLTALRSLRAKPFAAELPGAEHKLLAAVPDRLRAALARVQQTIGFEAQPPDIFLHPELDAAHAPHTGLSEDDVLTQFLRALFDHRSVVLDYASPYQPRPASVSVYPRGLLWDRDRWYLVGPKAERPPAARLWRADRVRAIRVDAALPPGGEGFDIKSVLGRPWLREAMARWMTDAPVKIRLTPAQAARLQQDWYYSHAQFEPQPDGRMVMTLGQDRREFVFELVRWLGPGAELLEPQAWRAELRQELETMLSTY